MTMLAPIAAEVPQGDSTHRVKERRSVSMRADTFNRMK